MISQEEVCVWFKNLEGYSRIELMCALLDSCLPLELRFLGTYLEYSAGKHYTHLQKWEKDANKTSTWLTDKEDFFNKDFRRKFCIFLALLHSHNRSIAVKLFDVLNKWERCINSEADKKSDNLNSRKKQEENCDKVSFCNEMRLLFSMASLHPALDFAQRAKLRNKKENFVSSCQKPDTEHLYEIENGYIEVDDNSDSDLPNENLDTSKLDSLLKEETRISTTRTHSLPSNNTLTTQTSIEQHTETPIPAPVPTNRSMVPEALQNIPHLTNISVLDNNGFHQMPPYRTPPMLFSRPQMSSTGTVYHRTIDPQSIQMPVGMPTIQCVVNNQQYVQNNISIHANSNTKNIGNVFSPTTSADLSRQSPLVPSELTIQQSPLVPNNDLLRVQSPLIPSNRTSDTLNNFNIVKLPGSQYGQIPRTMMNGPIGSPSLDDGSIPAHARHSGNVIVTCSGMVGGVSTVVSSMASINHQSNNQRRCYSESDANENINLGGSQEQLPLNQPRLIPYENKFHYFNSMQQMPFGNSQVHMSPKFFTATQNIQNMSTNNTVNISDSTPVPHQQQPIIIPYNTQQQQQQQQQQQNQQQRQQNQQQHQQHNMHNNMSSMVVHSTMPNIMTTNTAPVSVNPTPQQSLPTSKTEDKQPPPLMNQVISPSLTKNIPLGANGTYMPSQLPEKGISGNRILYSEQQRKFDFFMTKSDNNTNRSLPIPVQRRPYHNVNRYSNDVSPASSPSSSPRPSPLCSPSHSPLPSRKTTINTSTILTTSNKEFSDIYANTVNWLKSIRLHKYSNDLEHLSFKELSDMDEGSFKKIGLTVGASTKLKTQLDVLVNRGFKEFGDPDNLTNSDLPQHGTSPSSLSPISAKYLNSGTTTQQQQSSDPHPVKLDDEDSKSMTNRVVVVHEDSLLNDGVEMNERGDGMNERENEHSDEDDEVFQQQQHEARKKSSSVTATCYNCGHVGHYGDECTDETMEAITYNRYAFQLDYSRNESPTSSNTSTSSVKSSTVTVTTPMTSQTSVTMTTDDITNR